MKKKFLVAIVLIFVFGAVSTVNAALYYEAYTGYQYVSQGNSYNFEFDMWYENFEGGTNSDLSLTADAVGAFEPWDSATLYLDLYSKDILPDEAKIELTAYGSEEDIFFNMGTVNTGWLSYAGNYYYNFAFTSDMISAFSDSGWGNVNIAATYTHWLQGYNDFAITRVAMEVNTAEPVPEPAIILLLGAGLLGLIGFSRKLFNVQ